MPRYAGNDIVITVNDVPYIFPPRSIDDFPDARPFLQHLVGLGRTAPATAARYVKLVARLYRTGRLAGDLSHLHNVNDLTAAKAYRKWSFDSYVARTQVVGTVLKRSLPNRASIARLRRGSLVPPFDGKIIPVRQLPRIGGALAAIVGPPPTGGLVPLTPALSLVPPPAVPIEWVSTPGAWTLHVPEDPATPVHNDPCETCTAIVLDDVQLEAVASGFEQAWGHRDLNKVAADAFLFGTPPPDYTGEEKEVAASGQMLVLVKPGPLADALRQLGAVVARDQNEFLTSIAARVPDTVVISRETAGGALLDATRAAWERVPA